MIDFCFAVRHEPEGVRGMPMMCVGLGATQVREAPVGHDMEAVGSCETRESLDAARRNRSAHKERTRGRAQGFRRQRLYGSRSVSSGGKTNIQGKTPVFAHALSLLLLVMAAGRQTSWYEETYGFGLEPYEEVSLCGERDRFTRDWRSTRLISFLHFAVPA